MAVNVHHHRYRSPPPIARSIRFAPLPDPRRSPSLPSLPDDAPTSPISDDASSGSSSAASSPRQKRISYPVEHYPVASPPHVTPISPETDYVSLDTAPRTAPSKRSFLRPFFKKSAIPGTASPASSISLTPTPSIDTSQSKQSSRRFHVSAEDILTLGTIKLFRSVSRNNRCTSDNDSPNEWELSRWSSVNSAQSAPAASLNNASIIGSSLSRSQSAKPPVPSSGTLNGNKRRSGMNGGVSSASNTKPTSRKGVRMLNGRVYGAPKRKSSNPFDNVRDEADPEFVEWGYGGMGSVSGGRAAGMSGTRWERLQSGQSPDDPSLDEGSGMGWLKKRREARERAKAIEEAKDAQAADSCGTSTPKPDLESSPTAPVANPEENSPKSSIQHPRPSPNITRPPSVASTSTPRSSYLIPSEGEHVLHAVTIPAHFQPHHHHHHHSRSTSKGTIASIGGDEAKPNTPNDRQAEYQSEESESEEEIDDEEESDSSGFKESKRITALSAGVEKYTRHKENELTMSPVSE